ncbi:hypothetical protein O9202_02115, partial [Treponema pallidum]
WQHYVVSLFRAIEL